MTPSDEFDEDCSSILDLPQLYQKPTFQVLCETLESLRLGTSSFEGSRFDIRVANSKDVPHYLTNIISSSLAWLKDDNERQELWDLASHLLSERAGRSAMSSMTRTFAVPVTDEDTGTTLEASISLHEPSLTEDNLGLKTWGSSFVLAKQLHRPSMLPPHLATTQQRDGAPLILELGAGTGLLGLAAACAWHTSVLLTDMRPIVPNLLDNIASNASLLASNKGLAYGGELDWTRPFDLLVESGAYNSSTMMKPGEALAILVADPIYSPEHPRLLIDAILVWAARDSRTRIYLSYPLRDAYAAQISQLDALLTQCGLQCMDTGAETGYDDWAEEVQFCWKLIGWQFQAL